MLVSFEVSMLYEDLRCTSHQFQTIMFYTTRPDTEYELYEACNLADRCAMQV